MITPRFAAMLQSAMMANIETDYMFAAGCLMLAVFGEACETTFSTQNFRMSVHALDEFEKHTSKGYCRVMVAGQELNVTNCCGELPGDELAIITVGDKNEFEEFVNFNTIRLPDVV